MLRLGLIVWAALLQAAAVAAAPRLVSLAPHITELVYAAGAGEQLVGVVEYSDFPAAAQQLPRVGDAFRVDYEALTRLRPDIVLAWESGNPAEIVRRLRELGLRVVALEPQVLADVANQLEQIGELAGTASVAQPRAAAFRAELAELRTRYAGAATLRTFVQISAQPYFTLTGRHIVSEALELCGGENVFAELPGLAPAVSQESIILANPEVILAATAGDTAWQENWARWTSVSAVQHDALYSINPDYLSRSGPRLLDGVRQLCVALDQARAGRVD